jgi:hypothetical protein
MLNPNVTHYAPWTEDDHAPDFAVCGARMVLGDLTHSLQPTCARCVAIMIAEDARADMNAALDAQDDGTAAIVGASSPRVSSVAADLFAYAVALNRLAAKGGR